MTFALLSTVPRVTDRTLDRIQRAASRRLADVEASWSPIYSDLRTPSTVRVVTRVSDLTDDDVPMLFVATLDDPSALAYHDIRDRHAYGLILADDAQALSSIEGAAWHEIAECRVDPSCDLYAGGVALEVCDPCQGDVDALDLGDGTPFPASPFVTPAYFRMGDPLPGAYTVSSGIPLDPLGVRPGGYVILADGSERFGAHFADKPHRVHHHTRPSRRRRARLAREARA